MRSTVRDAAHRAFLTLTRGVLKVARDNTFMQEVDIALHAGETKKIVERFQNYGFTGVPNKEKDDKDKHPAEVLVGFINGNRSHAIVIACDDRRARLYKLKEGEVAVYDWKGQRVYLHEKGIETSTVSTDEKKQNITHSVCQPPEKDEEKSNQSEGKKAGTKQDVGKKRKKLTHMVQTDEYIEFQILTADGSEQVVSSIRMDRDGITLTSPNITHNVGKDMTTNVGNIYKLTAQYDVLITAVQHEIVLTAPKVITDGETHLDRGEQIIELYLDGINDQPATRVYAR